MEEVWPICSTKRPVWLERRRGRKLFTRDGEVGETSGVDPQSSHEGFYSKGIGKALESSEQRVTWSELTFKEFLLGAPG